MHFCICFFCIQKTPLFTKTGFANSLIMILLFFFLLFLFRRIGFFIEFFQAFFHFFVVLSGNLEIVFVVKTDYSPGQASGGSDDCILSTSVHHKGFGMKLSARASSLYVQTIPKGCRIIGRFSYCFQHVEGIVNPTCCLCYESLNLIPLFITVTLLFIIYCSNSRYFAYNSSKYRLHLYLLMFCKSVPMQYIKNDEYQSR